LHWYLVARWSHVIHETIDLKLSSIIAAEIILFKKDNKSTKVIF